MTKYLTEERFLVTSNTKESQRAYRDNYDRIFRSEKDTIEEAMRELTNECGCDGATIRNATFPIDEEPHDEQLRACDGHYDDGITETRCQNREGCGRTGCPAADFGVTPSR